MSDPIDFQSAALKISEERRAALTPEDERRILTAMRLLVDIKKLSLEGMEIANDLLVGKVPAGDIGMRLMDFERNLRLAGNDMTKRPLRVAHAEAFRRGETKLDEEPWSMRTRIRASEARKAREERARQDLLRASSAPSGHDAVTEEPESEAGPRF